VNRVSSFELLVSSLFKYLIFITGEGRKRPRSKTVWMSDSRVRRKNLGSTGPKNV
jgi:hypothetical protein